MTRSTLGTLVLLAASMVGAWQGQFGWKEIIALGFISGIPMVVSLVREGMRLWFRSRQNQCDNSDGGGI